jgi:hypothetical protein
MGRMKETLFNADVQPEMTRAAIKDYQIAECSERLVEAVNGLAAADKSGMDLDVISFLIDDLHTEILFLNDVIKRH